MPFRRSYIFSVHWHIIYAAYDFTWWRYSVFEIYVVDTDTNIEIEDYADTLVSKLFLGQQFDLFHSSALEMSGPF